VRSGHDSQHQPYHGVIRDGFLFEDLSLYSNFNLNSSSNLQVSFECTYQNEVTIVGLLPSEHGLHNWASSFVQVTKVKDPYVRVHQQMLGMLKSGNRPDKESTSEASLVVEHEFQYSAYLT
jgi:hypothetical protein